MFEEYLQVPAPDADWWWDHVFASTVQAKTECIWFQYSTMRTYFHDRSTCKTCVGLQVCTIVLTLNFFARSRKSWVRKKKQIWVSLFEWSHLRWNSNIVNLLFWYYAEKRLFFKRIDSEMLIDRHLLHTHEQSLLFSPLKTCQYQG